MLEEEFDYFEVSCVICNTDRVYALPKGLLDSNSFSYCPMCGDKLGKPANKLDETRRNLHKLTKLVRQTDKILGKEE